MKRILTAGIALLLLAGCVVQPAPYYGGYPPYYATTVAPAYVGVYAGGYYPYYGYHHIHSGYNNGYWHHDGRWGGHAPRAGGGPHH